MLVYPSIGFTLTREEGRVWVHVYIHSCVHSGFMCTFIHVYIADLTDQNCCLQKNFYARTLPPLHSKGLVPRLGVAW